MALILMIFILMALAAPAVIIWAVNVLLLAAGSALVIPITIKTWFATLLIIVFFGGAAGTASNSKR